MMVSQTCSRESTAPPRSEGFFREMKATNMKFRMKSQWLLEIFSTTEFVHELHRLSLLSTVVSILWSFPIKLVVGQPLKIHTWTIFYVFFKIALAKQ